MTTHKSDAVTAGIMPDFNQAGVVLNRSAEFTTADDSIVSGDTIQMVPIPKNAKVLRVEVYHSDLPDGTTGANIGYGGDPNAFIATYPMTGAGMICWPGAFAMGGDATGANYDNTAGFLHTFTADDTIDIAIGSAATKIPTNQYLYMSVYYKMTGTIADET